MKKSKKNANGMGSIRKRSNGLWEGLYLAGIDPNTGKNVRRSVYGKTQAEVRRKLTAAISDIDSGSHLAPQNITVEEWLKVNTA